MKILQDRSSPSKKKEKKHNRVCKTLNHPTNPFEDDWMSGYQDGEKKELVLSEEKDKQGKSPLPLCSESAICHSRD